MHSSICPLLVSQHFPLCTTKKYMLVHVKLSKSCLQKQRKDSVHFTKSEKKERTIYQHTGADRNIHSSRTHFTSQCQTTAWGEQCAVSDSRFWGEQRKGNSKYCQCPGMASWINHFLFVEFHFVLGTGFSVVQDTCSKKQHIQQSVRHNFTSAQRWVRSLYGAVVLKIWSILLLIIAGTDSR